MKRTKICVFATALEKQYWFKHQEIGSKIKEIEKRLAILHDNFRNDKKNYGFLGNLGKVNADLQEIIDFLPDEN